MNATSDIIRIESIAQLLRDLGLPEPMHPLVALVNYDDVSVEMIQKERKIALDFFKISFKPVFSGRTRYGQNYYDFQEGGLAFLKPNQIVYSPNEPEDYVGYALYFHPDFIRNYPLGNSINKFGFFSYQVSEALFLSTREKKIVADLFEAIGDELNKNIDQFTQNIVVAKIDLLLQHSNRFYNRQFITRKAVSHEILDSLDALLADYFHQKAALERGLPTVQYISRELKVSQRYLSDMMQSLTGLTTQQYLQNAVIEKAKEQLSTTAISVSEIAYELGFEHAQSFSKLFKSKTKLSPLQFRKSFD